MDSIIDLTLDDDEPVQQSTAALTSKVEPFTEFTPFPKLAIELRLLIWSFATPEPAIVVQRKSSFKGRRFFFDRPVPAIFQVNQESRNEFIENEPDKKNKPLKVAQLLSLERHRRDHPVYKMCFRNRSRLSAGAYFSSEIDSLFGMAYEMKEKKDASGAIISSSSLYLGVTDLSVGSTLKHLILTQKNARPADKAELIALSKAFPNLETLTILIQDDVFDPFHQGPYPLTYPPESDGQLSLDGLDSIQVISINFSMIANVSLAQVQTAHPTMKFPALKFRFEQQFRANENIPTLWHARQPTATQRLSAAQPPSEGQ
ncbi:hypothetical protein BDZ45DRAFT_745478 [Acephala macrosclerotiorum]|nr:hypothetical protein BDZ45DRAFT_745478 [Acephala macrosclerotiorum]